MLDIAFDTEMRDVGRQHAITASSQLLNEIGSKDARLIYVPSVP